MFSRSFHYRAFGLFLFVLGTSFAPTAFGGGPTYISGNQSGTLLLTNSPYVVTADITVPTGQILTIEPGVRSVSWKRLERASG